MVERKLGKFEVVGPIPSLGSKDKKVREGRGFVESFPSHSTGSGRMTRDSTPRRMAGRFPVSALKN